MESGGKDAEEWLASALALIWASDDSKILVLSRETSRVRVDLTKTTSVHRPKQCHSLGRFRAPSPRREVLL